MNRIKIILWAVLCLGLASCGSVSQIAYFQDTEEQEKILQLEKKTIVLRPEDKISVIVNTKDQKLSNLFNLPYTTRYLGATTDSYSSNSQGVNGYTIASDGTIDFPVVGKIEVAGLTREQVASTIKNVLEEQNLVKDPVVTVDYMNLSFSVLGEVTKQGRYTIGKDHLTILDAVAMAGDLSIYGRRDNIRVVREENGTQKTYLVDIRNTESLTASPAYYIQQNDVIYVQPNNMRARQSTVNGNNVLSTSFWISIASLAATVINTITIMNRNN